MPKAQKTPWLGYWEPTPQNQVIISRADRATSIYDRDVAFRQSQRDALIIAPREGYQQRSQKRGADFDDDSEGETFHTPKARCMPLDDEDISIESSGMVAQDSGDETEHQHANEAPASLTVPSNGQFLDSKCCEFTSAECVADAARSSGTPSYYGGQGAVSRQNHREACGRHRLPPPTDDGVVECGPGGQEKGRRTGEFDQHDQ